MISRLEALRLLEKSDDLVAESERLALQEPLDVKRLIEMRARLVEMLQTLEENNK